MFYMITAYNPITGKKSVVSHMRFGSYEDCANTVKRFNQQHKFVKKEDDDFADCTFLVQQVGKVILAH